MPSIFMSYRRSDSQADAGRIYDRLVAHFGKAAVFKDVDSIPPGVDFRDYLNRTLNQCQVVLALIGPHWLNIKDDQGRRRLDHPDDWVRIEIEEALRRQNVLVVPVLVSQARMPKADELPEALQGLAYRNCRDVRPDPDFNNDISRLITGLERYFGQTGPTRHESLQQASVRGNTPLRKIWPSIGLTVLGILTSLGSAVALVSSPIAGSLMVLGGVLMILHSLVASGFRWGWADWLTGIFYIASGSVILFNPNLSLASVIYILGALLAAEGIFNILQSLINMAAGRPKAWLPLLSGAIHLGLVLLIFNLDKAAFPSSFYWLFFYVGTGLLATGIVRSFFALRRRQFTR